MKKILSALLFAALALLTACGGGESAPVDQAQKAKPADVIFTNVSTVKSTTLPGQRGIEIAAFRAVWQQNARNPVSQFVFENEGVDDLVHLFDRRSVKLADINGDLNNRLNNYYVSFEGKKMIFDFFYGWQAQDATIPSTYSVQANVLTDTIGKKFSLKLVGVQMHDYGSTGGGAINGGEISVISIAGMGLPTVTSSAPRYYSPTIPGKTVNVLVDVSCPASNTYGCMWVSGRFQTNGLIYMPGFVRSADGGYYTFYGAYTYIQPGEKITMTFGVIATDAYLTVEVDELEFDIGNVLVSPIVAPGCDTAFGDKGSCKGAQNTNF